MKASLHLASLGTQVEVFANAAAFGYTGYQYAGGNRSFPDAVLEEVKLAAVGLPCPCRLAGWLLYWPSR